MRGGEVQLRASGERATQSFGVVQGGTDDDAEGSGCRYELWSSVSGPNSPLNSHSVLSRP